MVLNLIIKFCVDFNGIVNKNFRWDFVLRVHACLPLHQKQIRLFLHSQFLCLTEKFSFQIIHKLTSGIKACSNHWQCKSENEKFFEEIVSTQKFIYHKCGEQNPFFKIE